ncbi:hypothetical protein [Streptomyces sp. AcE210]|uniref:hypothetical protein n=1 Tax=Streptomyces sp. AcE210 TaxID=2292703 RepID=UPI000E30306E|nr:hypothetical protein [Streptomyces sp. AcE210]RFC70102.1 hypothetical protein DXZ75_22175 [Streptomyces sp. AcE210]
MPCATRDLTLEHFRWIDGHAEVWAVLRDAKAPASMAAGLVGPFRSRRTTADRGIESRGSISEGPPPSISGRRGTGGGVIVDQLPSDAGPPEALRALPADGDLPPSDAK